MIKESNIWFHIVLEERTGIYSYNYMDIDLFVKNVLKREDGKLNLLALLNAKTKGTKYSKEIIDLINILKEDQIIHVYDYDNYFELFKKFINIDKDIIKESLETGKYHILDIQEFLDDYIDNKYLINNKLESFADRIIATYPSDLMYSEDTEDEIFNDIFERLQDQDEFEFTLISCSENHSFYKTIEIPTREYLEIQLNKQHEVLKSPA
jgi:hypothetical protein